MKHVATTPAVAWTTREDDTRDHVRAALISAASNACVLIDSLHHVGEQFIFQREIKRALRARTEAARLHAILAVIEDVKAMDDVELMAESLALLLNATLRARSVKEWMLRDTPCQY